MHATIIVFEALRTFARPATRAEIEVESGLDKRAVQNGLAGLLRRELLVIDGAPSRLSTYALVDGACRPDTLRGKYDRRDYLADHGVNDYSPARPPSHNAQPGAARMVVKGILDVQHRQHASFGRCELAELWKKR